MGTDHQETGRVQHVTAFPNPIYAVHNGQSVRLLSVGDMQGKSPVYLAVDQEGNSYWESIREFQITDPRALPLSPAQLERFTHVADARGATR